MNCRLITKENEVFYEQMLELRQQELREPLGLDLFVEDLSDEVNQNVFILEKEGVVLSCLLLKKLSNAELKMRQMVTKKNAQGSGLGRALVQFAEEWAVNNEYTVISLHAREYAMPFYEKLGYAIEGNRFEEVGIPHYRMLKKL